MDIYIDGKPLDEGGGGGGGGSTVEPYELDPEMAGEATPGTSVKYSRGDHVHPRDTSKQDVIEDLDAIRAVGGKLNLLSYTTGTALSPQTAIYRTAATMSGTDATIPTPDDAAIPAADAYFCFEMEVSVDAAATSIAGPQGWTWLDGGELPTSGFAGAMLYIACRMDCTSRAVVANVWRVA